MGLTSFTHKNNSGGVQPPEEPDNKTSLDELVESIYNSVVFAQRKVETEHLTRVMSTYFDPDGTPKHFKVKLPNHDGKDQEVSVPLLTLAPHSHLSISELEMSFKVDMNHFSEDEEINNNKISAKISGGNGAKTAEVKIKLNNSDTPEGLAKINDHLMKLLP